MRIVVLGGGRVGAAMVRDLAAYERLEVVLVDASERALEAFADEGRVETRHADLSDGAALAQAIADADLVLGTAQFIAESRASDDGKEGTTAFLQKRKAAWMPKG